MAAQNQPNIEKTLKNKVFSLNPAQKAAAEAPISPLLIVAGAGTGKTRTLTSRIMHLVESGVPPERICAITFTNKAAQEMKDRVGKSAVGGRREPFIGTFHSLGARTLRRECRAFGRTPNFVIFDDHDSFDLVKKIVKGLARGEAGKKDTPAFFAGKISLIKNLDGAFQSSKESAERGELIKNVFERYEVALRANNAFDFDDLIEKPVALFRRRPEILKIYQTKFDAVLVDEYQDINPKQYELVKLLVSRHKNLSVVGDDEQTIYSWRYADIKIFLDFEKDWPAAKIFFLEENYRSTGNIIRAAQAVAENNRWRAPKQLWSRKPAGERIALFEAWGENEEAEWVAEEIRKIKRRDARAEVAILYRTNAQSRAIEQALIRHDMPYQIFGGLKFYERREVKDALAALRVAANDRDSLARERLEKNLSKKKFAMFKEKIAAREHCKPLDIIKIFLETFGYFDYLEEGFTNADEREENIAELIRFASGFENLSDFLEKTSLLQATDTGTDGGTGGARAKRGGDKDNKREKINLMTIHLAKGLEFENVFVAGVAEGLLPHIRSVDNELSLEEERRLMYVAMTRAKEKLHLSFYGMPSRFIAEIPEDCLALTNGTDGATAVDDETELEDPPKDARQEKIIQLD